MERSEREQLLRLISKYISRHASTFNDEGDSAAAAGRNGAPAPGRGAGSENGNAPVHGDLDSTKTASAPSSAASARRLALLRRAEADLGGGTVTVGVLYDLRRQVRCEVEALEEEEDHAGVTKDTETGELLQELSSYVDECLVRKGQPRDVVPVLEKVRAAVARQHQLSGRGLPTSDTERRYLLQLRSECMRALQVRERSNRDHVTQSLLREALVTLDAYHQLLPPVKPSAPAPSLPPAQNEPDDTTTSASASVSAAATSKPRVRKKRTKAKAAAQQQEEEEDDDDVEIEVENESEEEGEEEEKEEQEETASVPPRAKPRVRKKRTKVAGASTVEEEEQQQEEEVVAPAPAAKTKLRKKRSKAKASAAADATAATPESSSVLEDRAATEEDEEEDEEEEENAAAAATTTTTESTGAFAAAGGGGGSLGESGSGSDEDEEEVIIAIGEQAPRQERGATPMSVTELEREVLRLTEALEATTDTLTRVTKSLKEERETTARLRAQVRALGGSDADAPGAGSQVAARRSGASTPTGNLSHSDFLLTRGMLKAKPLEPSKPSNASEPSARRVIQELMETERNYINALLIMRDRYLRPLLADIDAGRVRMKAKRARQLFGPLSELVGLHERLMQLLGGGDPPPTPVQVVRAFGQWLNSVPVEASYLKYCTNHTVATNLLDALLESPKRPSDRARSFRAWLQMREEPQRPLSSLLIAPVQRLCRYPLLVESLAKFTPATGGGGGNDRPDEAATAELHAKLSKLVGMVNERKQVQDSIQKVADLSARVAHLDAHRLQMYVMEGVFVELPPLTDPTAGGPASPRSPRPTSPMAGGSGAVGTPEVPVLADEVVLCVLFDNVLLRCRQKLKGNKQWQVIEALPATALYVYGMDAGIVVGVGGQPRREIALLCQSIHERRRWLAHFTVQRSAKTSIVTEDGAQEEVETPLLMARAYTSAQRPPVTSRDLHVHFDTVASGDVLGVKRQLAARPELWCAHDERTGFTNLHVCAAASGAAKAPQQAAAASPPPPSPALAQVATFLVMNGAPLHLTDRRGNLALHLALMAHDLQMASLLLAVAPPLRECTVNRQSANGTMSLPGARAFRVVNYSATQLLCLSVRHKESAHLMAFLFDHKNIDVDASLSDRAGDSLLHLAARSGNLPMCQLLVDRCSELIARRNQANETFADVARQSSAMRHFIAGSKSPPLSDSDKRSSKAAAASTLTPPPTPSSSRLSSLDISSPTLSAEQRYRLSKKYSLVEHGLQDEFVKKLTKDLYAWESDSESD